MVNNFITKDDRTRLIKRYTFGEIGEIEYQEHDIPVRALLEYDDFGNLIYEDYSDLDAYIEEVLIPKYVSHNKRYNYEIEDYEYIPTIKLYNIIKCKYSEVEVEHIINYLGAKNVTVVGFSSTIDGEFENYNYYRNYKYLNKNRATIDAEENLKKFEEYSINKDPKLREELIISNMRLVYFVAYPFAIGGKWNIHDLVSYGSEGLIKSVDGFDISLGNKFSSYAIAGIKNSIINGIREMRGYKDSELFFNVTNAQSIIEEEYGKKLEEDLDMVDDIFDLLVTIGRISERNAECYKRKELLRNASSLEELKENEMPIDNNTLYYQAFHNITQEYIQEVIKKFPERSREIVTAYYGLGDSNPHTQDEIGKMQGDVSRSAIWQLLKKSEKKFTSYPYKENMYALLELIDEYNYEQPTGKIKQIKQKK